MKMINKHTKNLKVLFILIFIVVFSLVTTFIIIDRNYRVNQTLNEHLHNLQTHYDIVINYFIKDMSGTASHMIRNDEKITEILKEALTADENKKEELRERLYSYLLPVHERLKKKGVLQFQFVFPNNVTFLRMHKPDKYDDDLGKIRYSFKYVNEHKKDIYGFEQGRTTHAFRYVFPIFDKNEKTYLGAVEISLTSEFIQEDLSKVGDIHTHFLISKKIFDVREWERTDSSIKYIPSIESKDFMYSPSSNHDKELFTFENKIIGKLKSEISQKTAEGNAFSLFSDYTINNSKKIISFVPIKNIKDKKTVAYLVSYTDSHILYSICLDTKIWILLSFIILIFLLYFIYKTIVNKQKLDNALNIAKLGSWEFYIKDKRLIWGDNTYSLFGYEKKEIDNLTTKDFYDLIPKGQKEKVKNHYIKHLKTKEPFQLTYEIVLKDGSKKYIEHKCKTVFDNNTPLYSFGTVQDITENELLRIENQKQTKLLIEQSKMAALGEMIGNIAHQWRQPLSVISTQASGLQIKLEFDQADKTYIDNVCEDILTTTSYLSKTIDDFRDFIKGDKQIEIFDVSKNFNYALSIFDSAKKQNHINILFEKVDKDCLVKGYKNELIQAVLNILYNAKDALLDIEGERYIFISIYKKDSNVIIEIKDNGGGVDKNSIQHIFEPYYTTKNQMQGSGLGLYMTYKIIDDMKGKIEVFNENFSFKNEEYRGALFLITFKSG